MPDTLTTYDAAMKDVFLPGIKNTLNNDVTMFQIANAAAETAGGRRLIGAVKVDRNWGLGTRTETGALPTAGNEVYVTSTVTPTYFFARFQVSDPLLEQAKGDQAAFADAMTEMMDSTVQNSKTYFNRMLYNGSRGDIMRFDQARATASTASFVVTSTVATGVFPRGNPARYLAEGQILDGLTYDSAGAAATATNATAFTSAALASVTVDTAGTTTITFAATANGTATVTVVSGTILVFTGSANRDFLGLEEGIENSGTYLGIARGSFRNRGWRGNVEHNSGTLRSLSLDLLQQAWDGVSEASGRDAAVSHLIGHYSVRRQYIQLLSNDIRFAPMELKGGQNVLSFNGAEFKFEKDAPYHTIYGIDASTWHLYKVADFSWLDRDGSVLSRVNNLAAYEATLKMYGNFATDAPNRNFKITDVNATL